MLTVPGSEYGHVEEASEYRFFLHRHWSLYDAMYHSPYMAAKLGVWNSQGTGKLLELLARMGVPLHQCKQSYQFMTPSLRAHFASQMGDKGILEAYGLTNPGVTFKSFYRYNSFKNPVAASDVVHAATALTEMYGVPAYSGMGVEAEGGGVEGHTGMRADQIMGKGIQAALDLQRTIVKKASAMLEGSSSIHRCHRLHYAYLSRATSWGAGDKVGSGGMGGGGGGMGGGGAGVSVEHSFGRPTVLAKLGQYIMDIKRNMPKKAGGWAGSSLLPFVLLSEKLDGNFLVVGISPFEALAGGEELTPEQTQKLFPLTNFRQFFHLAGQLLGAKVRNISFDANVVEVGRNDVQEFLGALDDSLRKASPRYNTA
ncbi:CDC45-like protein-domain-containing protein [Ochromonadaceae sp. CCMP2298]|nr:CDC45-like protein-domain-containing protein [Ochromonadaceae sp. CCMP2298]